MASTRTAFIGDLHYPRDTSRLVQLVNTVKPHILVFNGDFLDTPTEKSLAKFTKLLKRFRAEEILFTLGNHEHYLSRNKLRKHWSSLDQARGVMDILKGNEAGGLRVSKIDLTVNNRVMIILIRACLLNLDTYG